MSPESQRFKVTAITAQARNTNRVNVYIGGEYKFSLDIYQVTDLGIRIGKEYTEEGLASLIDESAFGKLYARTLEYTMMRPHSAKEIRDYLYRKTFSKKKLVKNEDSARVIETPGVSKVIAERVYDRLLSKGYIDDKKFSLWWVENRNMQKGTSMRKMYNELLGKGVAKEVIEEIMQKTTRDEKGELDKMIAKKSSRYDDRQKFTAYLVRQGFSYDDVREALDKIFN